MCIRDRNLVDLQPQMQTAVVAADRLREILDLEAEKQENDVPRAQGHGVEGRKGGRVHVEQREDHRQRGDGRCPWAFTVMPEAVSYTHLNVS